MVPLGPSRFFPRLRGWREQTDELLGNLLSPNLPLSQGWEGQRNTVARKMKDVSPFPTAATAAAQVDGDTRVRRPRCIAGF